MARIRFAVGHTTELTDSLLLRKAGQVHEVEFSSEKECNAFRLALDLTRGFPCAQELPLPDVDGMQSVYVTVTGNHRSDIDQCVQGRYRIFVNKAVSDADLACFALNRFHETIPIRHIEDFTFLVEDEYGRPLAEAENYTPDPRQEGPFHVVRIAGLLSKKGLK